MAERERVQKAIEAPVAEAAKLLEESRGADLEARLAMLIDGWGRGLPPASRSCGLPRELRRASAPEEPAAPPAARPVSVDGDEVEPERHEREAREARDEEGCARKRHRSREATNALREESQSS